MATGGTTWGPLSSRAPKLAGLLSPKAVKALAEEDGSKALSSSRQRAARLRRDTPKSGLTALLASRRSAVKKKEQGAGGRSLVRKDFKQSWQHESRSRCFADRMGLLQGGALA